MFSNMNTFAGVDATYEMSRDGSIWVDTKATCCKMGLLSKINIAQAFKANTKWVQRTITQIENPIVPYVSTLLNSINSRTAAHGGRLFECTSIIAGKDITYNVGPLVASRHLQASKKKPRGALMVYSVALGCISVCVCVFACLLACVRTSALTW